MPPRTPAAPARLHENLVLFNFVLHEFGCADFDALRKRLDQKPLTHDDVTPSAPARRLIDGEAGQLLVAPDLLRQWDANVVAHLATINRVRPEPFSLQYYQYAAALFTEYYLYHYFQDAHGLLQRLNAFKFDFCAAPPPKQLPDYTLEDLNKLAFWAATGSGKTLLLHLNLLQYRHHCPPDRRRNLLLLTPNDELSQQHLRDLRESGDDTAAFYLDEPTGDHVKLMDLHKLYDRRVPGEKKAPIDISAFEDRNALFVDEGHLGSTQEESAWRDYRDALALDGFTFEYSATFGQINNPKLQAEYARCILFDYSYRHFYYDGYGKDYRIENLAGRTATNDDDQAYMHRYLLLHMLLFVQQVRYFRRHQATLAGEWRLEAPLMLFVGNTVNKPVDASTKGRKGGKGKKPIEATTTEDTATPSAEALGKSNKPKKTTAEDDNKQTISDVQLVLRFLNHVLNQSGDIKGLLTNIRSGQDAPYELEYRERLAWLFEDCPTDADLYNALLEGVFHTDTAAPLQLHVLSQGNGEVGLKVGGGNHPYFGLIYIGDVSAFRSGLEQSGIHFETDPQTPAQYPRLDHPSPHPINLLIGARRFIVGWNSFRVSGIGLINFGATEGTQIIQLFGRGVRLRGRHRSLRRSTPTERPAEFHELPQLETLNVFGLKAGYMQRFRDELMKGGVAARHRTLTLPVHVYGTMKGQSPLESLGLLTLARDPGAPAFATANTLTLTTETVKEAARQNVRIRLDISTRRYAATATVNDLQAHGKDFELRRYHSLVDFTWLYRRWQLHRQTRGYHNLTLQASDLPEVLNAIPYTIVADRILRPDGSAATQLRLNQLLETVLLRFTDAFYRRHQRTHESQFIVAETLTPAHPSLATMPEYTVELAETDEDGNSVAGFSRLLQSLEAALSSPEYPEPLLRPGIPELPNAWFNNHLYQPLLAVPPSPSPVLAVRPVPLSDTEARFVQQLRGYLADKQASTWPNYEFYLLRNPASASKGIGLYFDAAGGFYPDFLLWIKNSSKQHLAFIDPHGLRNETPDFESGKIQLFKRLRDEIQPKLGHLDFALHSFILSPNSFEAARVNQWQLPAGITNLREYARTQHVYELPLDPTDTNYLDAIFKQIIG